jgi:phosphoribosylamine--glycine ligase
VTVTPGNAGMAAHGIDCVDDPATKLEADLFVIGPEQPLVEGLADELRAQEKLVVGPGRDGARLEGSKSYLKEFLEAAGVPTARYGSFRDEAAAVAYLRTMDAPYVIKTDGLAAGKGVLVTSDFDEACCDVRDKLSGSAFGAAGTTVVIEEGLDGPECSLTVLCDGAHTLALAPAQDFKRVGDGDRGANTGGMGAYAPMNAMNDTQVDAVMVSIVEPTMRELHRRGVEYRGVLYAGLMLTPTGPKLLEYNVRFGDPEAEVLAPLYGGGLFDLLCNVAGGSLKGASSPSTGSAVTVVLASHGYPASARHGDVIHGLGDDGQLESPIEGVVIFHAGTKRDERGRFVTAGGRVLAVTGVAATMTEAHRRAYRGASLVTFEGKVTRSDIAQSVI